MSYIKIKPIWTKKDRFSKEEAIEIFEIFKTLSPVPQDGWEKINLVTAIAQYGQFMHPETDKEDDTEGIQPKQVFLLKETLGKNYKDYLKKVISLFNSNSSNFSNLISDGFVSWNLVFEHYIVPNLQQDEKIRLGLLTVQVNPFLRQFTSIDAELLEKIGNGEITEIDIQNAITTGIIKSNAKHLTLEMLDIESYLESRKKIWKEHFKNVPQSSHMLRVNPENFSTELLDKIQEVYGTRQIAKLSEIDQINVSLLIDNFGINILSLDNSYFKNSQAIKNLPYGNSKVKDFNIVLTKIIKELPISLNTIKDVIKALGIYTPFYDYIMNMKIEKSDLDIILYITNIVHQINSSKINTLDPKYFRLLYRYRIQSYQEIVKLISLFEKNMDKETTLPNLKGSIGNYKWEIIKKDNPIGLMLGYATDCCQVIGGDGESCLKTGYEEVNSSFFVVTKGDKIYAQSWCWSKEKTKYGSGFCFDSAEVLGKDLNKSKDILKCYEEAAEALSKFYDVIYVGADGNSMPEGLEKIGKEVSLNEVIEYQMDAPFKNAYSDLTRDNGGAFIIKRKGKNE